MPDFKYCLSTSLTHRVSGRNKYPCLDDERAITFDDLAEKIVNDDGGRCVALKATHNIK